MNSTSSVAYIGSSTTWLSLVDGLRKQLHASDLWLPQEWEKPLSMPYIKEIHRFASQTAVGKEKVICIPFADLLKLEPANALLKLLEEPPTTLRVILFAETERLLPTIRSRVQLIRLEKSGSGSETDFQRWYDLLQMYTVTEEGERKQLQKLLYLTPLLHQTIQAVLVREAYTPINHP